MDFNGLVKNKNVDLHLYQILMINVNIIKDLTLKMDSVKIIVIVLLLGMIGNIMFALKLDVVLNVNVGRFLII